MRTTLMIGAIALFSTIGTQAQDKKASHPMDKAWVAMNTTVLNVELKLNDDQQAKVKEIDQRFTRKEEALEAVTPKLTDTEMSNKVEALMDDRDNALREVLNKDQYASWSKMRHKGTSELRPDQKDKMKTQGKD